MATAGARPGNRPHADNARRPRSRGNRSSPLLAPFAGTQAPRKLGIGGAGVSPVATVRLRARAVNASERRTLTEPSAAEEERVKADIFVDYT